MESLQKPTAVYNVQDCSPIGELQPMTWYVKEATQWKSLKTTSLFFIPCLVNQRYTANSDKHGNGSSQFCALHLSGRRTNETHIWQTGMGGGLAFGQLSSKHWGPVPALLPGSSKHALWHSRTPSLSSMQVLLVMKSSGLGSKALAFWTVSPLTAGTESCLWILLHTTSSMNLVNYFRERGKQTFFSKCLIACEDLTSRPVGTPDNSLLVLSG